ncbi:hypothetical protein KGQ20_22100 [Catenulispora sp. NF23]|uniref:Uncharacterized protein n=1 Tax=Catenulispora pinistramenti TaxID=2705254 RepID=A0ABS5KVH5_9ACTN|nr:hypothetical protein [Catenulispora pinistramenti]MBS2535460.1 hypothetical protein [Catenulispora pinistramenti]MBS2550071.1 hypothetical protein [Catenulispora pinistramenti]
MGSFVQNPTPASGTHMFLLMIASYVSNLTLGRELGHNQGLDHDWATEPEPGTYPYAHGWMAPSKQWRTIMAYDGGCNGCERINHHSDADATYKGGPLGASDSTRPNTRPHPGRELAFTGMPVPLVETSLLAGPAMTVGGALVIRLRRRVRE